MRIYTLKPGTVKEYKKCFNEIGYPIISKYLNLVGFWYTEVGNLNQMVSIWAYESTVTDPLSTVRYPFFAISLSKRYRKV